MPRGPKVTQDNSNATNSVHQTITKATLAKKQTGSDIKPSMPAKRVAEKISKVPVYSIERTSQKSVKKIRISQRPSIASNDRPSIVSQIVNLNQVSSLSSL